MTNRNPDVERWLASEEQGDDAAAEAGFAQLFAALPKVEPGPEFFERTAVAAWSARLRRRTTVMLAQAAASIVVVVGGLGIAYAAMAYGGAVLVTTGVALASRAMVGPILFMANSIQWWSTIARAAATVGDAIATPANQVALISAELWCVLAVYGLHRLLRMGLTERVN
jgi:hypothetical protein